MSEGLRKIEVLREGAWAPARLAEIRKGERFRYTEDGIEHVHTAASDGWWSNMEGKRTLDAPVVMINAAILVAEDG